MDTLSGPQPSAEEVRVIELINRARRDPQQEVEVMSRNVKLDVLVVGDEVRIDYW